ncbi:hypothetical protein D3C84_1316680 [compost metagenome]
MYGQIDLAMVERFFQLLDEQPFAADGRKRDIAPDVARGANRDDLGVETGVAQQA